MSFLIVKFLKSNYAYRTYPILFWSARMGMYERFKGNSSMCMYVLITESEELFIDQLPLHKSEHNDNA